MDAKRKKELMEAYKNRTVIGGVFCVQCSGNGRKWIRSTVDMNASKNRFMQSVQLSGCPEPAMMREWKEYGTESFSFEPLEELKKKDTQTDLEFKAAIKELYEKWLEKEEAE